MLAKSLTASASLVPIYSTGMSFFIAPCFSSSAKVCAAALSLSTSVRVSMARFSSENRSSLICLGIPAIILEG